MPLTIATGYDWLSCHHAGREVLRSTPAAPAIFVAKGQPIVTMVRGNFDITDTPQERTALAFAQMDGESALLSAAPGAPPMLRLSAAGDSLRIETLQPGFDRVWINLVAQPGEHVWGGGEQMSYLDLSGRRFPIWTSEPGVGRDKSTELTRLMDAQGMAGGDYWWTNYPQPTFLTSSLIACHLDSSAYSVLDFSDPARHRIEVWEGAFSLEFFADDTIAGLVGQLSTRFGRQPPLPDWAIGGAIVGLKHGEASFTRLERILEAGAQVSGLWCEDWIGIRQTTFGRRLFWDWSWNPARYPALPDRIAELAAKGIRFLGYVNPYLADDGAQYQEALSAGYLALRQDSDAPYLVDFGEFDCGVVDFTNPAALDWFAERVIGREMLDFGLSGWMADFGEYLPVDLRLHDGSDPMLMHNRWPVLWAECNAKAIASRGKTGDAMFFMRAGFSGVQAHCPLLWAGDQSVDFTRHDGIGTVLTAALSAGLVGNACSHSDVGGYTSLHGNVRTADLLMRWCELGAFSPVMRSHEGNRPDDNLQIDSSDAILAQFAAMSKVHAILAPYVRHLSDEAVATGLPVQRPLFLHYFEEPLFAVQDQYLYGADMLVAPIVQAKVTGRSVILPGEQPWRHLWSGKDFAPGTHFVDSPYGQPPVFYRPESRFAPLFATLETVQ
ncbi:alpha-glucosidase [Novosphingobium chloroacetimidivorans]|uniref:Alpha-glucosidase n=1 Tax=Novosphingobium chloroacetimidivorans TaxID=1428314 RepID=A0A7W7NWD0_9SPHN|nr:alpha-glucosidase [Novosphingobium chloroacetimidivorans]MBB4858289.1 alpha-glucosidase [Novosphingobium chloroacetimidivorans]